jgi:hypothetical protein
MDETATCPRSLSFPQWSGPPPDPADADYHREQPAHRIELRDAPRWTSHDDHQSGGTPARGVGSEGRRGGVARGDLSRLSPAQRMAYCNRVCETLGLNPLTQPFAYLRLNGKRSPLPQKRRHGTTPDDLRREYHGDVQPKARRRLCRDGEGAERARPDGRLDRGRVDWPPEGRGARQCADEILLFR